MRNENEMSLTIASGNNSRVVTSKHQYVSFTVERTFYRIKSSHSLN